MKKQATSKPKTVDAYLSRLSPDQRAALQHLRQTIQKVLPKAEECISYQMPAFRLDGKVLVWFGAGRNHVAFYPGGGVDAFKSELSEYETSKGTIRFQPDHPLPVTLVRKLITARRQRLLASRGHRHQRGK